MELRIDCEPLSLHAADRPPRCEPRHADIRQTVPVTCTVLHASLTSASTLFGGIKTDSNINSNSMTWVNAGFLWVVTSLAVGEAAGVMARRRDREVPVLF